jgi:heparanase 1
MNSKLPLLALAAALSTSCKPAAQSPPVPSRITPISVNDSVAVAQIDERYLAFAIDTAQVVGAKWWNPTGTLSNATVALPPFDFTRPRLRRLAQELSPARLRIGGTEADRVYYDLSASPVTTPPAPFTDVLTHALWDGVNAFAIALGFDVLFTLNAGPGPRDASGAWTPDNAKTLLDYTQAQGYPVAAWELGNEVNMYPLSLGFTATPVQFVSDVATARALVDSSTPGAKLTAPATMYLPVFGEVLPFLPAFADAGGGAALDALTWHYYPQQSDRCPLAPTPASVDAGTTPGFLGEIDTWASQVESQRDLHASGKEIWLAETGNAQCGGEPGVSDVFVSGFWWLDELARVAHRGESFVIRHTLSGSSYGLLDDVTLTPRPDYWTAVLWRRLIGSGVLDVPVPADPLFRAYAHCTRSGATGYAPGAITLIVLNLDPLLAATIPLGAVASSGDALVYELSSPELASSEIDLNGIKLVANDDGSPPPLAARTQARGAGGELDVQLGPTTYGFIVLPGASAPACD